MLLKVLLGVLNLLLYQRFKLEQILLGQLPPKNAADTFAPGRTCSYRSVFRCKSQSRWAYSGVSHNHDFTYSALGHTHTGTYAPAANGVTNGDSHDHSGGDGGTISYNNLSDKPSIPSARLSTPANLGTATAGTGTTFSREDHIHNMPTASQVGALASGANINLSDYKVQRPYLQDWAEVVNARGSISRGADD